jgi:Ca2+-transporting ATPase
MMPQDPQYPATADRLPEGHLGEASWHHDPLDDVLRSLQSGEQGLSAEEARARLGLFGPNVLPRAEPVGPFRIFLRQFKNPLVYLLLVATLVSLFIGELLDALFIFIVLFLNAAIGTIQEWQAHKQASELDQLVPHRVIARRAGLWIDLAASELVPGDIVKLETGTKVSADLRLIRAQDLVLDESLLTGESVPVDKQARAAVAVDAPLADRANMLFAGTTVLSGRALAVVVATSRETEIGKIAAALSEGEGQPPPLILQLERFSRLIGVATIILIGMIAVAQAAQGTPLVTVLLVAIALAVAAIPEGLPVAITVALAIATNRMQRRKVIVRSLPAVEGLGACTLIASDKTGTLTCNELTVKAAVLFHKGDAGQLMEISGEGYHPDGDVLVDGESPDEATLGRLRDLAVSATLCNEAAFRITDHGTEKVGDTVDVAFLVFAAKLGLDVAALRQSADGVSSIPYEPERRYAATFVGSGPSRDGSVTAHVKGAAEALVPMCGEIDGEAVLAEVERLASAGYRVLAVARGTLEEAEVASAPTAALEGLEFLGLVGLMDPVRPEAKPAIDRCREAGITVCMITGDHPTTALTIARQLGIAESQDQVAGEGEVRLMAQYPEAFQRYVAEKRVFARIEPVQKLAIVQALQRQGHVVAVTGDGVNDGPALKAADIGVAMGLSGTDVARGAADLVIADDNFASIVAGIEEGRIAYDNIRKLIYLLISTGLGEIVLFILAIVFGLPPPLFAVQLLWLNLVTNGLQDVALAFEKGEPGIGRRPPRSPREPLFDRSMTAQVAVAGIYMGSVSFAAFHWFLSQGLALDDARNLVLLLMVLFENAHALNARSERQSIFRIPLSANWFLLLAVVGAQAIHIASMFIPGLAQVLGTKPIGILEWALVAAFAASLILVMELFKKFFSRRFDHAIPNGQAGGGTDFPPRDA